MNVDDLMRVSLARAPPRREVRMLLSHVLKRDHAWLVAHDDYLLSNDELAQFNALAARRAQGEPVAYLVGEREFYGRAFRCTPAALIPRPETEMLVDLALDYIPHGAPLRILDVGTGTGCIAITLALERPATQITATDISAQALALAKDNAQHLGVNVAFVQSNWFAAIPPDAQFDVILSNPPYIVPGDAHLTQGDLRFEPAIALTDAVDGLESYRRLAHAARHHLAPHGLLIVEHGYDQGDSVPRLFRDTGLHDVATHGDLAGHPRITECRFRAGL